MPEFKKGEITKKERKLMFTYVNFKAEVQLIGSKLKAECSKSELGDIIK